MMEKRVALNAGGMPHAFVWYGPGSQWIEHELGVFRSLSEYGAWCSKEGCDWILEKISYDPELLERLRNDPMPHFVPPFKLTCSVCGAVAYPWKLWKEEATDGETGS